MKTIKFRAVISSLLILLFIIVVITGIGLAMAPSGKIAQQTAWTFLGKSKWQLEKLHTIAGFTMAGLIIIHLFINYKMLISEIKILFKKK